MTPGLEQFLLTPGLGQPLLTPGIEQYLRGKCKKKLISVFFSSGPCKAATKVHIDARNIMGRTALHDAITTGHRDVVKYLLENGADVNLPIDVENSQAREEPEELARIARKLAQESEVISTPLKIACSEGGALDMTKLLLDMGAEDPENKCLELACRANNDALVSLLLRKGMSVHVMGGTYCVEFVALDLVNMGINM